MTTTSTTTCRTKITLFPSYEDVCLGTTLDGRDPTPQCFPAAGVSRRVAPLFAIDFRCKVWRVFGGRC